ncbi:MAG: ABC transporter permease [Bacteroidales bacterium]|nr:ABC transporter permease [Bacteroidales bacterium]
MHSFRFLNRHKGYVLINLIGLATGLAGCLLMVSYLKYQSGFDSFHVNKERIYRGRAEIKISGKENTTIHMPGLLGEAVCQEVPGVEAAVRLHSNLRYEILCGIKKFIDQKIFFTDSTFFKVFSYKLLTGNPAKLLNAPFTVVLTKPAASRMFGGEDPIGKTIKIDGIPYEITGLLDDLPGNSHITFDLLAALSSITRPGDNVVEKEGFTFPTYFLLREGTDTGTVLTRMNQVFDRIVDQRYGKAGLTGDLYLQPLLSIHTTQLQATDYAKTTPKSTLTLFTVMAIFILLVGVINFINLTTALYERRSKEIGIKKVIGATPPQLFWQTMRETSVLVAAALIVALLACEILVRWVRGRWALDLQLFYKTDVIWAGWLIAGAVVITFLSSAYPNWYLSRLNPGTILKEDSMNRSRKFGMAKLLVLIQYGLSTFIICLMLLFSAQLKFVAKADLGFDMKGVVVYENLTNQIIGSYNYLKNRILQLPSVSSVTASLSIPGKHRISNSVVYRYGSSESSGTIINVNRVQQDYLKTYGIQLVQGEDFSQLHNLDSLSYIINEEAVQKLGLENPIGEEIVLRGIKGKVIGVVKNFRTKPLYSDFDKEILTMQSYAFNFISIRLKPGFGPNSQKEIESVLTGMDPGYQPISFFVEDMYRDFYQREERQLQLVFSAAIVGIILSVMGLISLMVLTLQKQRKEIGVRKVFGASGETIFILLVNRMMKWVLLSNLIAWPVAYLVTSKWLDRFACKINLVQEWPLFLLSGGIVAILAFLSIGIQSYGASRMSPADVIQRG